MQYQIFLQRPSEEHFVASVFGFADVVADGKTEQEAVGKVKAALEAQLSTTKILTVDIEADSEADRAGEEEETDPWVKRAGAFADDPTWDDFLEEISAYRKQVDEETMI